MPTVFSSSGSLLSMIFIKKLGAAASEIFLSIDHKDLKGVLIGGPSPTKEEFTQGSFCTMSSRERKSSDYLIYLTQMNPDFPELLNAAGEKLQDLELMGQKNAVKAFFKELISDSGKVAYGETQVRANLEINAVEMLLLSEDLRAERVTTKCSVCGYENKWTRRWKPGESAPTAGNCPECGSSIDVTDVTDIVDELSALADKSNARLLSVSTDFDKVHSS